MIIHVNSQEFAADDGFSGTVEDITAPTAELSTRGDIQKDQVKTLKVSQKDQVKKVSNFTQGILLSEKFGNPQQIKKEQVEQPKQRFHVEKEVWF